MHLVDEICYSDKYKGLYELIEEADVRLDHGALVMRGLNKSLEEYTDPHQYDKDFGLSEEDHDVFFEEDSGLAERSEENIEKYKQGCTKAIIRRINVAYTHASLGMDLLQKISEKLDIQLEIEKDVEGDINIVG